MDDLRKRRLNVRSPSPYNDTRDTIDTTPKDVVRTAMFQRLLQRAAGIRNPPTPLDLGTFAGVQHRLTAKQVRNAIAKRRARKQNGG